MEESEVLLYGEGLTDLLCFFVPVDNDKWENYRHTFKWTEGHSEQNNR